MMILMHSIDRKGNEPMSDCTEPDGQELASGLSGTTQHDAMIRLTGQCPWCGEEGR